MRLRTGLGSSLGLFAAGIAATANAVTTATISIDGGAAQAIPLVDATYGFYAGSFCSGNACVDPNSGTGWTVDVDVEFDPDLLEVGVTDPYITWGIAVYNHNGADLPISIVLSTDDNQVRNTPGIARTSLSGSTTNANNEQGVVTITPLAPPGGIPVDGDGITEVQVFTLSNDFGATPANAGIDLGLPFSSNGALASDDYPAENSGWVVGPLGSGQYNFMRLDINFSVSDGGDRFTANGSAVVAPEPGTAALVALGLGTLAYAGRRRAQTSG